MNTNFEKPSMATARTKAPQSKRSIFFNPVFILAVLVSGSIIGYQIFLKSRHSAPPGGGDSSADAAASTNQGSDELKPVDVHQQEKPPEWSDVAKRGEGGSANRAPGSTPSGTASAPAPLPPEAVPSQQIIGQLAQVDLSKGELTSEQAQAMAQNLKKLAQQGAAAVPAIREFLDRNQDMIFEDVKGAKEVGYSSLRAGLLDALKQIGGPEALGLMASTLQTTADPREIAMLARNLEEAAPGQFSQETLNSVRETLAQAAKGDLGKRDVGPLFQVLQTLGDATVAADLQKNAGQWNYYATMTLATLPEGAGVPALIDMIKDSTQAGSGKNNFALQMLAQISPQYPDAAAALLEQAKLNQIPDRAWRQIATGLSGDQYQFAKDLTDGSVPARSLSDLKFYHIEYGNQNFYSTPVTMNWQEEEINQ